MKYTLILLLFTLAVSLFVAKTTIEINPFKISFERPLIGIGLFLLMWAFIFLNVGVYESGVEAAKKEQTK